MAEHHVTTHVAKYEPSSRAKTLAYAGIAIGVLTFVVGLLKNQERLWPAYLVSFFFFTCLSFGGLFFVAINHMAKAGWSAGIRRIAEAFTSFIPVALVASLVLALFGAKHLYPWADVERVATDAVLAGKQAYLNKPFTIVRWLIFGLGMMAFAKIIVGNSLKQDQDGREEHSVKNTAWSVGFAPFFAIGFSLFTVDLLMSLAPYWYSTIFGIYCFAGLFQSFLAAYVLVLLHVKNSGVVKGYVTTEHVHDVAKYLKAFTVFWAYIAFSQFMLIWYANIPEETEFYLMRAHGGWTMISMSLLVLRFIVPFLALLPRAAKRTDNHLILVSSLILVMQFVDIYWLVYPNFNEGHVAFGLWEVGMFLGFGGLFLLGLQKFMSTNSLVAVKDPRMKEALNHHVMY